MESLGTLSRFENVIRPPLGFRDNPGRAPGHHACPMVSNKTGKNPRGKGSATSQSICHQPTQPRSCRAA